MPGLHIPSASVGYVNAGHPSRLRSARSLWVAVALIGALAIFTPAFAVQGMGWADAVSLSLLLVASGSLLTWAAWRIGLTRNFTGTALRTIALHVLAAVVFASLWALAFAGAIHTLLPHRAVEPGFRQGVAWLAVWGFAIYAAVSQLTRARASLRERALAASSAELVAIRSQMDPHFLFNTLHSLTQLAREDPAATESALERFGGLMHYVLGAGKDATSEVSLEEELAFIEDYLALEKLRLNERLRVSWETEADALELAVPPLLLQPLVENAVRHGVAPRTKGGTIRLAARVDGERLKLEVGDDGVGAEPDGWGRSRGFGLRAVAHQLRARHGHAASLEVETAPGKGFIARISMPAHLPQGVS